MVKISKKLEYELILRDEWDLGKQRRMGEETPKG